MLNSFNIPYICDGEITGCNGLFDSNNAIPTYTVLARMPDGSETFLTNVPVASMFGGIGDYSNIRLRQSFDDTKQWYDDTYSSEERKSSPGDRVLICFINADVKKPIIIGFYPHPARQLEDENASLDLPEPTIDDPTESNPNALDAQMTVKYQGIETNIDTLGQMTLTHRGAPAVSWDGSSSPEEIEATGPAEYSERNASDGQAIPANDPIIPEKSQNIIDNGFEDPFGNPQLVYPKAEYTTRQGFLSRGEWYVADSEGQQVFLDRDSKTITLTNGNDTIQIDKENKSIFISSSGNIEKHAAVDSVTQTDNNEYNTVTKDSTKTVNGNNWKTIGGNKTENVIGDFLGTSKGSWTLQCEGTTFNVAMSSGNTIYMDDTGGQQAIYMIHNNGSMISISQQGNILIMGSDGSNVSVSGENNNIMLQSSQGSVISVTDQILIADNTGTQMISLNGSNVEISASAQVTLSCDSVNLNCGSVALGAEATMSSIVGENLQSWLDSHIHSTGVGPSGPPVIMTATLAQTPADILSKYVKVRGNV